ncbi:MAG: hypothetical protein JHD31_03935 [Rhodoluna sp.]|nr:hypothetical protein [Rhodoluna sp.]
MNISKPSRVLLSLTLLASLFLAGCSSPADSNAPVEFGHVHGIVDLGGGKMLLGTHTGIYSITSAGEVSGPIGGNDFDAMGITGNNLVQYASGHPGPNTSAELGSPSLGIVRSVDLGTTWTPVAFNGVEDFHVLTASSSKTIFGIGSSSSDLRISLDGGMTWTAGPAVEAVDLAVTSKGSLFAATPTGLQLSQDQGSTFSLLKDSPTLYNIAASQSDGIIGVDVTGILWRLENKSWQKFGSVSGTVEALIETSTGSVVLVDDRGVVSIDGDQVEVIHSTSMNH